jgi:hypothetical protein
MTVVSISTQHEDICHGDVIDAVERVMKDARRGGMVPRDSRGFMFGYLAEAVARFLNAHPEHRVELLPELEAETAGVAW